MQKKVIALAVAGLVSGAAFAQSNVTIYGVVDAGYVNSSGDRSAGQGSANFGGIQSGVLAGSRIGFRGEEGLGNGLKAVFTLEYALNVDDNSGVGNTGGLNARQQFVGLNHAKLGTVSLGRQYAPAFAAMVRVDPLIASDAASALVQMNRAGGNTIYAATPARINNSIAYASPTWSGFRASAIYGFGESATTATAAGNGISVGDNGFFGAGLNYANGPLNLDAVYQTRVDITTAVAGGAAEQKSINEWMLGGSYDFKVAKVFASYQDQNDSNGTSNQEASNHTYQLGVTVPVFGNGTIRASYAKLNWDNGKGALGNGDSDAWAIGYTHALSKRTTLYTTFTLTDNDNDARIAAGAVSTTRAVGENNTVFAAGINHTF